MTAQLDSGQEWLILVSHGAFRHIDPASSRIKSPEDGLRIRDQVEIRELNAYRQRKDRRTVRHAGPLPVITLWRKV